MHTVAPRMAEHLKLFVRPPQRRRQPWPSWPKLQQAVASGAAKRSRLAPHSQAPPRPGISIAPATYPLAVGALTGRSRIGEDAAVAAYLQAFAANLISAGVRLIPLGQSAGLAVLAGLEGIILSVVNATRHAELDDIGGACWRSDIAGMRHETQYTRLFRT